MLHDPSRHEPLAPIEWNEALARDTIAHVVADAETRFSPETYWPLDRLESLIETNVDHPARELMWGAPGTMLAALFLHERTGDARWARLFRMTAGKLRSQLLRSDEFACEYWSQDLYGHRSTYLDAVHGFVA